MTYKRSLIFAQMGVDHLTSESLLFYYHFYYFVGFLTAIFIPILSVFSVCGASLCPEFVKLTVTPT